MFIEKILYDEFGVISLFNALKTLFPNEYILLLESSVHGEDNQSIITISYIERIYHKNNESFYEDENKNISKVDDNPLIFLQKKYKKIDKEYYQNQSQKENVAFIDGFVGYIGFDIVKEFSDKIKDSFKDLQDDTNINDLDLIRPKIIISYCHKNFTLTITSDDKYKNDSIDLINKIQEFKYTSIKFKHIKDDIDIKYQHNKDEFFKLINEVKEKINSGDVFQLLLSNRATLNQSIDSLSFFRTLRSLNPSPYMYLLDFLDFQIVGSSPETMVELKGSDITLKPIAGTRKRGSTKQEDLNLENELKEDTKEIAEHIMLVDLGRNDLNKVAQTSSVKPEYLMSIEKYSHVMHIVSKLKAKLDDDYDMFDLFMATFNAGTMSGTPKIKAMELICKFEKLKRSFYSGVVGYFSYDGNMDNAIAIRTALVQKDKVILQAGAGIVEGSKKELEFLEVNNKLQALIVALNKMKLT